MFACVITVFIGPLRRKKVWSKFSLITLCQRGLKVIEGKIAKEKTWAELFKAGLR